MVAKDQIERFTAQNNLKRHFFLSNPTLKGKVSFL
jgi:hypothetical protein